MYNNTSLKNSIHRVTMEVEGLEIKASVAASRSAILNSDAPL